MVFSLTRYGSKQPFIFSTVVSRAANTQCYPWLLNRTLRSPTFAPSGSLYGREIRFCEVRPCPFRHAFGGCFHLIEWQRESELLPDDHGVIDFFCLVEYACLPLIKRPSCPFESQDLPIRPVTQTLKERAIAFLSRRNCTQLGRHRTVRQRDPLGQIVQFIEVVTP